MRFSTYAVIETGNLIRKKRFFLFGDGGARGKFCHPGWSIPSEIFTHRSWKGGDHGRITMSLGILQLGIRIVALRSRDWPPKYSMLVLKRPRRRGR